MSESTLTYKGSNFLKQRILLSTLSGRELRITEIRKNDPDNCGLREYEVSLIRLFDKITNGSTLKISSDGTQVFYQPGLLVGGKIEHSCSVERGIGYFLDVLIALGPFCKTPLDVVLKGVTNSADSPSVDHIKYSAFSCLKKFLIIDEGLSVKVIKRGLMPLGGGEVHFTCPVRKSLKAIQCLKFGMVKRIRGIVYACKVSPTFANRTVESSKGVMLNFLPDIYIHTDQNKGKLSGLSPGYGINLMAETNENIVYSVELITNSNDSQIMLPEDLGQKAALKLLDEIYRGGCCDSTFQWLVCLYMALGQKNVSKFVTGPLSKYTISFLQHLREFFGITFKIENCIEEEEEEDRIGGSNKVTLTCVGIGYSNISKRTV